MPPVFWSQVTTSSHFPGTSRSRAHAGMDHRDCFAGCHCGSAAKILLLCVRPAALSPHPARIAHPYVRGLTTSVIALLTLSFSPCGDCWTLLRSRRDKQSTKSSDYTWPVRLLQLYLVEI